MYTAIRVNNIINSVRDIKTEDVIDIAQNIFSVSANLLLFCPIVSR